MPRHAEAGARAPAVDGESAKGRWMSLSLLGDGKGSARFEGGIYEGLSSSSFGFVIGVSPSNRCSKRRYVQSQRPSTRR